jgi:hypothetical protein
MFPERGQMPVGGFHEFRRRLAIRPAHSYSFKVGRSAAEGHYKLHKTLAAASVPPPYELASPQGQ